MSKKATEKSEKHKKHEKREKREKHEKAESEERNDRPMRIGVVGMGPVGTVLVAHLMEAGALVVPCEMNPLVIDAMKKKGLHLESTIVKSVKITEACYSIQELKMYDLDVIVIAVKTPGLRKVVDQIKEIVTDRMYVVVAQNGIDNEVTVARAVGDDRTLRMVINYAGNKSAPNITHVSFFNPPNYIAPLLPNGDDVAKRFAEMLNAAGLTTEIPEDIQDYVWEKAILNSALSAVCAITRKTMKDVMDYPLTLELVEALIDESVRIADAEGIDLGKKFRRFSVRYLKNAGHHRPSMLVDIEEGRRTEIDNLNGKMVYYGHKHCLPTPLNQSVTALIHLIEHSPE
ncbi:MAG: 2-dehydropantoate 2-reductase [Candidatus Eisenbacteria bacterium]